MECEISVGDCMGWEYEDYSNTKEVSDVDRDCCECGQSIKAGDVVFHAQGTFAGNPTSQAEAKKDEI